MIYEVIVDISNSEVDRVFDYKYDDDLPLGSRVNVPFGNRLIEGYVINKKESSKLDSKKLKYIISKMDDIPLISEELIDLMHFMVQKYHLRIIDILRLFIPSQIRGGRVKELIKKVATLNNEIDIALNISQLKLKAVSQRAIVDYLIVNKREYTDFLNKEYGNSAVKALIAKGIINIGEEKFKRRPYKNTSLIAKDIILNNDQHNAIDTILSATDTYLLFGVTGSGKTEVYMNVINKVIETGKTAIMLVPEISLTPNMLRLFRNRFGDNVAILHSGLSAGERFDEWTRLKTGDANIAIGARSAVFAPLNNIGIIIIDEEHDGSYQSDSNPRYNTIDIAKQRVKYNNCSLVLGSATPSLESFLDSQQNKIKLIQLKNRINNRPLPKVELVNMSLELKQGNKSFLSNRLKEALTETINNGDQAIIFLNRRGYSSFVMCNKCGYVAKCDDCDVSLTYHSEDNYLKCHYCGKKYYMLDKCPSCKNENLRQGKIGTEKVVAELNKLFPNTKIIRMDNDTTSTKESHFNIINSFANGEAQILVGTQMVSKGHDFSNVTLVGILDGDQSLYYSDFMSSERTFQLLTQVAGRCGRDVKTGTVILQTYTPTHYVLQMAASQDYLSFYKKEINIREATNFPPFTTLIRLLYSDEDESNCIAVLNEQFSMLQKLKEIESNIVFLQKMKSPVKKVEKKFRYQILMRIQNNTDDSLYQKIFAICDKKLLKTTNIFIELNPQNLN